MDQGPFAIDGVNVLGQWNDAGDRRAGVPEPRISVFPASIRVALDPGIEKKMKRHEDRHRRGGRNNFKNVMKKLRAEQLLRVGVARERNICQDELNVRERFPPTKEVPPTLDLEPTNLGLLPRPCQRTVPSTRVENDLGRVVWRNQVVEKLTEAIGGAHIVGFSLRLIAAAEERPAPSPAILTHRGRHPGKFPT